MKSYIIILAVCILATSAITVAQPYSGVPGKISYQGAITYLDAHGKTKIVKAGKYFAQFQLFDDPSAGTMRYTESDTVTTDKNGIYTRTLGDDGTPRGSLPFIDSLLWLKVTILSGPDTHLGYPYPLPGRIQLTSVPYALEAGSVAPQTSLSNMSYLSVLGSIVGPIITGDNTNFAGIGIRGQVESILGTGIDAINTSTGSRALLATQFHAAEFTGDVIVNGNISYTSPKTGYVTGAAWASGRGLSHNNPFTYSAGIYNDGSTGSPADYYEVPLNLPDGSTLLSVEVYGNDVSAVAELYFTVGLAPLFGGSGGSVIGLAGSGVSFAGGDFIATASAINTVVDNSTFSYWIELTFPPTSDIHYYSYRATFSYNTPGAIGAPIAQAGKTVQSHRTLPQTIPLPGAHKGATMGN
ncbi:MAG: hypothetical protein ACHQQQ_15485 [Bacteroidota bacterium]